MNIRDSDISPLSTHIAPETLYYSYFRDFCMRLSLVPLHIFRAYSVCTSPICTSSIRTYSFRTYSTCSYSVCSPVLHLHLYIFHWHFFACSYRLCIYRMPRTVPHDGESTSRSSTVEHPTITTTIAQSDGYGAMGTLRWLHTTMATHYDGHTTRSLHTMMGTHYDRYDGHTPRWLH